MFNLFGKKKKENEHHFTDLIFISAKAKENALLELARTNSNAVFIAWFADTAQHFTGLFRQNGITEIRVDEARYFSASKYAGREIIFLEHFPLREKEEVLVQNCEQQKFAVYSALTEPIFTSFGGDKIIQMMERLGMKENEAIQHAFINSSIKNAQEKIAKKLTIEQPADSQATWFQKNVPSANT